MDSNNNNKKCSQWHNEGNPNGYLNTREGACNNVLVYKHDVGSIWSMWVSALHPVLVEQDNTKTHWCMR